MCELGGKRMINSNTLIIKCNVGEQQFMETLLNMKHSGLGVVLPLSFYALVNFWHIDKFSYYMKLLEEAEN